jgi:arabinosyltransferase C
VTLRLEGGELATSKWMVRSRAETLDRMPVVTGVFTELDLRDGVAPSLKVTTRSLGTSQTTLQQVGALLGILLGGVGLALVALSGRWNMSPSLGQRARIVWRSCSLVDGVVMAFLVVWWIIAPPFSDTGWIRAAHVVFDDVGGLHFYFDVWGIHVPVGYWVQWLRNGLIASTSDLIFLRVPALAILSASWFACRWCLALTASGTRGPLATWTLAAGFLTGAFAWGMTLRLEPLLCLGTLGVLAAVLRFRRAPNVSPLAVAVPLAAIAATTHPAGVVACAPLFAALPEVRKWLGRTVSRPYAALAAVLACTAALGLVLSTVDADLATRLADARIARANETFSVPFWREYLRYREFDRYGGATAVRQLSLGFLLLAVAFWITRRRRGATGVAQIPARALLMGLLLLALVPSKWPWHFGALLGLGAVALAAECERLRREDLGRAPSVRPFVALSGVVVLAVWAWHATSRWSTFDLAELRWDWLFGFGGWPWWRIALLALAVVTPVALVRRRTEGTRTTNRFPALVSGSVVVAAVATLGGTVAVLFVDAVRSPQSLGRQNLAALGSAGTCGLADRIVHRDVRLGPLLDGSKASLVEPAVAMYVPCSSVPRVVGGVLEVPTLVVLSSDRWLIEQKDAPFSAIPDLYSLTPIRTGVDDLQVLAVNQLVAGYARADARRVDAMD